MQSLDADFFLFLKTSSFKQKSRRVKGAINIRPHPIKNINRESRIEIPLTWMSSIRRRSIRSLPQRTAEGAVSSSHNTNNALDRNPRTLSEVRDTPIANR